MGLFDFLGDIVSTPFDMMGLSRHSRDQQIEQQNQRELMALQDQYHDENFSTEFAAENKEWWNRYLQTQSPAAQARQYRQIGVNPSAMIQNGSGGFHQTPVQTTAPSPPNITPPSQGQIYQGGNNTDLLGDISRMELNEAQKDEIYALLSGKLKQQEDVHFLNEVVLAYKKLDYNIYQVFGYNQKSLELSKLYEDAFSSYLRGEESKANTKFLEARTILENDEHVKNKELLPTLRLQADALLQFTKAQANEANARASESYASAAASRALAKLDSLEYEIKRNMQGAIEGSLFEDWKNKASSGEILNWQIDAAKSAAEIARVSASHAEALFWKDFIIDLFNSGVDAFTQIKNSKSWYNMSENQKANVDRKLEEMKWKYGDNVIIESRTAAGGKKTRTFRRPYSKYKDSTD